MDLKARAIKSTAWYATTRLWMQGLSWVVTVILARLLTPSDYGLFAMALTVITVIELLQEFGLGAAIIQRQNINDNQINTIFWIIFTASLLFVIIIIAVAGPAAIYYDEPRLVWIIRILGFILLLNSFGTVPYSLLTKEIDFRRRSLAEAVGVVTSVAVSLSLAYFGYGVWSLVGGHLLRAGVRNTLMAYYCRWFPKFSISFFGIKDIMNFSLRVAGGSLVSRMSTFTNPMIIGKFLGETNLGLYSMADTLGTNPFHRLSTSVINQISLPVFSKLQNDEDNLRAYFLKITKYLAVIAFPLQVGMLLVADQLVPFLLSDKWIPIVELVQIFSIGGIFYILPLPSVPLITSRGKSDVTFRYSIWNGILMIVALLIGVQFGLRGVALSWFFAFPIMRLYLLSLCMKEVGVGIGTYFKNINSPLFASMVMTVTVTTMRLVLGTNGYELIPLSLNICIGAVSYIVSLLVLDIKIGVEIKSIISEMFATGRSY